MPRRNKSKHSQHLRAEGRFDTDICYLPCCTHVERVSCYPLKTIYRNMDAVPWAEDVYAVRSMDDPVAKQIIRQLHRRHNDG